MSGAKLYFHASNRDSEIRARATLMTLDKLKSELVTRVKELPCELPASFDTLLVRISNQDEEGEGTFEIWEWGSEEAGIDEMDLWGGRGSYVEVDGEVLHDSWEEHEDEEAEDEGA